MRTISCGKLKCSVPKTAIGMARNKRPNGKALSSPCACGRSFLITVTMPITRRVVPAKYAQKTGPEMNKTASAASPPACVKRGKQQPAMLIPLPSCPGPLLKSSRRASLKTVAAALNFSRKVVCHNSHLKGYRYDHYDVA